MGTAADKQVIAMFVRKLQQKFLEKASQGNYCTWQHFFCWNGCGGSVCLVGVSNQLCHEHCDMVCVSNWVSALWRIHRLSCMCGVDITDARDIEQIWTLPVWSVDHPNILFCWAAAFLLVFLSPFEQCVPIQQHCSTSRIIVHSVNPPWMIHNSAIWCKETFLTKQRDTRSFMHPAYWLHLTDSRDRTFLLVQRRFGRSVIRVACSADEQYDREVHHELLAVLYNGTVKWIPSAIYKSSCQVSLCTLHRPTGVYKRLTHSIVTRNEAIDVSPF